MTNKKMCCVKKMSWGEREGEYSRLFDLLSSKGVSAS